MLVRAPLMKTEQNRSIRVEDLPEVVMGGTRCNLTEQRLIPPVTAGNIRNTNDCPRAFHLLLLRPNAFAERRGCDIFDTALYLPRVRSSELLDRKCRLGYT